jgi:hypothetical protein
MHDLREIIEKQQAQIDELNRKVKVTAKAIINTGKDPKEVTIDEEVVSILAQEFCTNEEIAAVLRIDLDTVTARCSELIKNGRQLGKQSLRRLMWQHAKVHPGMAIFLAKNLLGMSDITQIDHAIELRYNTPINIREIIAQDPFVTIENQENKDGRKDSTEGLSGNQNKPRDIETTGRTVSGTGSEVRTIKEST